MTNQLKLRRKLEKKFEKEFGVSIYEAETGGYSLSGLAIFIEQAYKAGREEALNNLKKDLELDDGEEYIEVEMIKDYISDTINDEDLRNGRPEAL